MPKKVCSTDSPIHEWFELSHAQFLTVPRLVMESMSIEWQEKMARLLDEMDEALDWRPREGRYWVRLRDARGRFSEAPLWDYRHGKLPDDMFNEYDFSKGVRGKYAKEKREEEQ